MGRQFAREFLLSFVNPEPSLFLRKGQNSASKEACSEFPDGLPPAVYELLFFLSLPRCWMRSLQRLVPSSTRFIGPERHTNR